MEAGQVVGGPGRREGLEAGEGVAVELGPLGDGLGTEVGGDTEVALDADGPRELGMESGERGYVLVGQCENR